METRLWGRRTTRESRSWAGRRRAGLVRPAGNMSKTRIAVIGVGHLGQHHARLLASIEGVELVGVCDTNRGRADDIAAKFGGQSFGDVRDLVSRVDAVTIAAPTVSHLDIALPFLEAGIATLVEK